MSEATSQASRELPRYRSHKEVWALKIGAIMIDPAQSATFKGIHTSLAGAVITPAEPGFSPFRVDGTYMAKHSPEVGGYWVRYADGYESFSPCEAFEEGYSPVSR